MKQVMVAGNAVGFPQAHLSYYLFLPWHLSLVTEKWILLLRNLKRRDYDRQKGCGQHYRKTLRVKMLRVFKGRVLSFLWTGFH